MVADNLAMAVKLPQTKMAAILADDTVKWIFLNENGRILILISLKFVPMSSTDNMAALGVQVMAWHWTGDKPLLESMMTQFTDAYMPAWGEMGWAKKKPFLLLDHLTE